MQTVKQIMDPYYMDYKFLTFIFRHKCCEYEAVMLVYALLCQCACVKSGSVERIQYAIVQFEKQCQLTCFNQTSELLDAVCVCSYVSRLCTPIKEKKNFLNYR